MNFRSNGMYAVNFPFLLNDPNVFQTNGTYGVKMEKGKMEKGQWAQCFKYPHSNGPGEWKL